MRLAAAALLLVAGCSAGAQALTPAAVPQPQPEQSLQSGAAAGAEPARIQRPLADATPVLYTAPVKLRPQRPEAVVDTVPPTTTAAPAPSEVTYCMARLESLRSLFAAITSRRQQVSENLERGDIAGAQMAYDVMRWATEDFQSVGEALVERCSAIAAGDAAEAQAAVDMAQALWRAAEDDCRAHLAGLGLDCG